MTRALYALFLSIAAGAVSATEPEPTSRLHLDIARDGKFEVFSSRSDSAGISILFGLIGVGVQMASTNARDAEREEQVAPEAGGAVCRHGFERALYEHLEKNGFVIEAEPNEKLPVLEVAIVACGFRVLNRTRGAMSAFFESKYRFTQPGARRSKTPQRHFEVGKHRAAWPEFEKSPAMAAEEIQKVLNRAGQRLANKIIYARGN